jgi:hypothetical protein
MATTTNYSWSTPDDTALVKDGAAAIRSLGTAIDSTVFTNAGNAIQKTLIDAKGDLIVGSAADTVARLAAGTNGHYLSANSGATNGVEWVAPPSSGSLTLINTGGTTLSGATTTISSIPSGYKHLELHVVQWQPVTDGSYLGIRYNSDSNTRYAQAGLTGGITGTFNANIIYVTDGTYNASATGFAKVDIYDYANTSVWKVGHTLGYHKYTGSNTSYGIRFDGHCYNQTTAITSITFSTSGGDINSGTAYLYGVK